MSRLFILTKNYLKLITRSKMMLIIIVLGTIMVIAALSSSFKTLLSSAGKDETFDIGYYMSEDSRFVPLEKSITDSLASQGIRAEEYDTEDPDDLIKKGDVEVFIIFEKDSYRIIGDKQKQIDLRIVQFTLYNVDRMQGGVASDESVNIKNGTLESYKMPEADEYYSIVQMVYFLSLGSVVLTQIYMTERKHNISMRFKTSSASGVQIYLGKYLSSVIVSCSLQVFLMTGLVTLLFDVHLGKPVESIGILMLASLAFCALGMLFFTIFGNVAVSIALMFVILWLCGLLGGTFETYMYSSYPEKLKELSPIYYVNRSLVELITMGESDYLLPTVAVMVLVMAISIPAGILITSRKREV